MVSPSKYKDCSDRIQEPPYLLYNEWMGIAICAVFSRHHPHDQFNDNERTPVCRLIANGYQD